MKYSYTNTFLGKLSGAKVLMIFLITQYSSLITPSIAQGNYPVTTTAYFMAPFSQRLSNYFTSDKRLTVDLLLKDLTKSSIQVYLEWSIEGAGIRIHSRAGYIPPSFITLQRGIVSRQHGSDLMANYFNLDAIETEGIDLNSIYNIDIPEGFYTLHVTAFEASTGQVVSNTSENYMVLAYPPPPILNLPLVGNEIPTNPLQKIPFLWSPRHFSTANTQAVYKLRVCEVPDDQEPNEQIMLTCTEPRLEITVPQASYNGDITQYIKPLEVGKRYAWQVSVEDLSGELNNFANQGRSEVSWFRYGKECVPPPKFNIKSVGSDRVQLTWERQGDALGYIVEYSQAPEGGLENGIKAPFGGLGAWTAISVSGTSCFIPNLNPKTTYVFRIRSDCGGRDAAPLNPSAPSDEISWNRSEDTQPDPSDRPVDELPIVSTNPWDIEVQSNADSAMALTDILDLYRTTASPLTATAARPEGGTKNPNPTQSNTIGSSPNPSGRGLGGGALLSIPLCAQNALNVAYACSPTHPTIPIPNGTEELTSLAVGDVLGISDFAIFVTQAPSSGTTDGLGQGLMKLPFLGGKYALVEFSGLKAKKGEAGSNGGCVYEIATGGYCRVVDAERRPNATEGQTQAAYLGLIKDRLHKVDTLIFRGTLKEAITKYDSISTKVRATGGKENLITSRGYASAIIQGSQKLLTTLESNYSNLSDPTKITLLNSIKDSLNKYRADLEILRAKLKAAIDNNSPIDPADIKPTDLTQKYNQLFEKVKTLQEAPLIPPTSPTHSLSNVRLSNINYNSATLDWLPNRDADRGYFDSYTITYAVENGGNITQNVTKENAKLLNLRPNTNYNFKISGIKNGEVVATYGSALFATPKRILPPPTNLAYTVQTDGSVKITWDKNREHLNYKLVYKDQNGEERTLYPTTNQAILRGLDADQIYNYNIVASGAETLESEAVSGSFGEMATCSGFYISPLQINLDGILVLSAGGCKNESNNTLGKICWTLEYYNYDKRQLDYDRDCGSSIRIPKGKGGYTEHSYSKIKAECILFSDDKSCSIDVDLGQCGDFWTALRQTYPYEPYKLSEDGRLVTLTSPPCKNGEIKWSTGQVGNQITVNLNKSTNYIASCSKNGSICASLTIPVKSTECNEFNLSSDRNSIESFGTKVELSAGTCFGRISWSSGQYSTQNKISKLYVYPQKTTTYSATCTSGSNVCKQEITIVIAPDEPCTKFKLNATPAIVNPGEYTNLEASGCAGTVTWLYGVGSGNQITLKPSASTTYSAICKVGSEVCPAQSTKVLVNSLGPFQKQFKIWNGGYVDYGYSLIKTEGCMNLGVDYDAFWYECNSLLECSDQRIKFYETDLMRQTENKNNFLAKPTWYSARCYYKNNTGNLILIGQTQYVEVKPQEGCDGFNIATSKQIITSGESVTLMATGCKSGMINWSHGVGENLVVSPTKTTTYTAICSSSNCQISITVNVIDPNCKNFEVKIPQPSFSTEVNTIFIPPIATGCSGNVVWLNSDGSKLPPIIYGGVQTNLPKPVVSATYTALCEPNNCKISFTLNTPQILSFLASASPGKILSGQQSILIAQNCEGELSWEGVNQNLVTKEYIVYPTQTTTYTAKCKTKIRGYDVILSSFTTVIVDNNSCNFIIKASPAIVSDDNNTTTLVASGCDGVVTWNNDGRTGSSISISPETTTVYTATCSNPNCTSSVPVTVLSCDNFKTERISRYTIAAYGCPSVVIWTWNNGSQTASGQTINPEWGNPTTYTATCSTTGCVSTTLFAPPPQDIGCKPFKANATPELIYYKSSTDVIFSVTGCEAGSVKWSNGKTSVSFTESLKISDDLTYNVDCIIEGNVAATTTATVKIRKSSSGVPENPACKNFYAYAIPQDPNASGPPYAPGTPFVLKSSGCPNKVIWSATVPSDLKVSPNETTSYLANCYDATGSICVSAYAQVVIVENPCTIYGTETDENWPNGVYKLTNQIGINGEKCPGTVTWYKNESKTQNNLICQLSPQNPVFVLPIPLKSSAIYYHDCDVGNGKICSGNVAFVIGGGYSSKRVAATSCLPVSLQNEIAAYMQKLVCDSKNNLIGNDGKPTIENLTVFLAALQQVINIIPELKDFNPDFSKVSATSLIKALENGTDCKAAGEELAKAFSGKISPDDYNAKVNPTYVNLLESIKNILEASVPIKEAKDIVCSDFTKRYFITPAGKWFRLPAGAKPQFFKESSTWTIPNGTLQGFELADKSLYYAVVSGPVLVFDGYYKIENLQKGRRYTKDQGDKPANEDVYFLNRFESNNQCGYNVTQGTYQFQYTNSNYFTFDVIAPIGVPPLCSLLLENCPQQDADGWVTDAQGNKYKTIVIDGNSFKLTTINGNVTVNGTWQTFGKCATCPAVAEAALQAALSKARAKNNGKLTENTVVVAKTEKQYGTAGSIYYSEMKLLDILKNLSKTYNSLLDKAKVPEAVWKPQADLPAEDRDFFVQDKTGVIVGSFDGVAGELTDKAQLVGLGLQLVSDPEKTATDLVNFAQTMDWDKAQKVAITLGEGLVNYDAAEFDKGGIYARHATGKVGGSLAINASTLLLIVTEAPNILRKASDILKDWIVDLSKVRKIGGSVPKNALSYTGKKYSFDVNQNPPLQAKLNGSVPAAVQARLDALHVNYPNGVDFDEFGFARFEPYTVTVNGKLGKVEVQTAGNRNADFAEADRLVGIDEAYRVDNQLVWHHGEDTKTMILVPKDIHSEVKHTGGIAVFKNDINLDD